MILESLSPTRRELMLGAAATVVPPLLRPARAQAAGPIRVGVLGDFAGPYSYITGEGCAVAARMAAADVGGSVLGRPVEIVTADHMNKPDTGLAIVREWFGPGNVQMVTSVGNSAIAFGIQPMLTQQQRVAMYTSVGNPDLIGKACSPNSVLYALDNWASTVAPVRAQLRAGKKRFYFVAADYAFGKTLEADATAAITAGGGTVVGISRHPLNNADFSSYLIAAKSSGAEVVMLLNGGTDFVNSYKQAIEFGVAPAQIVIAPVVYLGDIDGLGLEIAQGLQFSQSWYWDLNDTTRAWSARFGALRGGRMPADTEAGTYSAVLQYLKAVATAGTDAAEPVMAALRATTVRDAFTAEGHLRADGRFEFDRYLVRAKKPNESKGRWDYLTVTGTVPAATGFKPLVETGCSFVKS